MDVCIAGRRFAALLFDLDGVVTDTARLHQQAWRATFDPILREHGQSGFTDDEYRAHVDGRRRIDGVSAVLTARGIPRPLGNPDDEPASATAWGLAERKDDLFRDLLAREGVPVFDSTVALLRAARAAGVSTGLISASRNAERILAAAGLADLFDVRVDGVVADSDGLPGKPDPATFLAAAAGLAVEPAQAVVVEDAVAGVRAGCAGGFGLVVGVDRTGHPEALTAAGADVVVPDLADLAVTYSDPDCRLCASADSEWRLDYVGFDPALEGTRETLLTLGNGYLATRGANPETTADGVHYPGTYLASLFNRVTSTVNGLPRTDESMVNAPNWLPLRVEPAAAELVHEHRTLDMRAGVLHRESVVGAHDGRRTRIRQRRLVSMAQPHLCALETTIIPLGWSGPLEVRSGIDGGVRNTNVADFAGLGDQHFGDVHTSTAADTVTLTADTTQSHQRLAVTARTNVLRGGQPVDAARRTDTGSVMVEQRFMVYVAAGEEIVVEKVASVRTTRDRGITEPVQATVDDVSVAGGFDTVLAAHTAAWDRLWNRFHLCLTEGVRTQMKVNLHAFHLLQALSPHTMDLDAGVPARGLHGEGYRGHIFWDEMFVLPFLTLRLPELTRALLLYRYRRLPRARELAAARGARGAQYPWQSGSDGRDETPDSFYNPRSGRWMPDRSRRQFHVGLAIAFNVWQYWETTADLAFIEAHGAEMLVEIARFWAGISTHDPADDRYDIRGIMGPDEFHDGYPDRAEPGIDNSAYVNIMASWVLQRAGDVLRLLGTAGDELRRHLGVTDDELRHWDTVSRRLRLHFLPNGGGILAQFDGYDRLAELDWTACRDKYGNIGRLDLILEAEGDTTLRYKASKQADVLMLLYLFSADELTALIHRLGYPYDPADIPETVRHYLDRTSHGSTLSRVAHAWVLSRSNRRQSWRMLGEALDADLADTQGGTTREGIHLGAIGGTLDLLQRCYTGLEIGGGTLRFHPQLPDELRSLYFDLRYRGMWLTVTVERDRLVLQAHPGAAAPITVALDGHTAQLVAGTTRTFEIAAPAAT